jgi:hypothetical protein
MTSKPDVCPHGSLRRSCEICERDERIVELQTGLDVRSRQLDKAQVRIAELEALLSVEQQRKQKIERDLMAALRENDELRAQVEALREAAVTVSGSDSTGLVMVSCRLCDRGWSQNMHDQHADDCPFNDPAAGEQWKQRIKVQVQQFISHQWERALAGEPDDALHEANIQAIVDHDQRIIEEATAELQARYDRLVAATAHDIPALQANYDRLVAGVREMMADKQVSTAPSGSLGTWVANRLTRLTALLPDDAGVPVRECAWTYFDSEDDVWETSCGESWIFVNGSPTDNHVRFCHGCGKPVRTVLLDDAAHGEEDREPCSYCGGSMMIDSANPRDCPYCDDGYAAHGGEPLVGPEQREPEG